MLDLHTLKKIFVCAKHFDPDDVIDTQTYLDIDGQTKTRPIKATLKQGAVPKYLPGCPDRLNDKYSSPLVQNDPRFDMTSTLVRWLEYWTSLQFTQGKLTAQTFTSFRHTSIAIPKLVQYLTGECGFSYVLSSFIQNDPIEHHFGLYRQMSGSNYNISVCEVLESERVLKLSNILKLYHRQHYDRKDRASFMEFLNTFELHGNDIDLDCGYAKIDVTRFTCVLTFEDFSPNSATKQALAFIGGYAAFSLLRKLSKTSDLCPECYSLLTEDKTMEIQDLDSDFTLIQLLDRGGLKWPSTQVIHAVFTIWKMFTKIECSPVFIKDFLRSDSRSILVQLTLLKLESEECEGLEYECFDCCTEGKALFHTLLTTAANCLLNNKAKNLSTPLPKDPCNQRKYLKLSSK